MYGEGGLSSDGITPSADYPSIYQWRSSDSSSSRREGDEGDNDGDGDMIVSHTYQSQSNILTNLIQYRCKATQEEYDLILWYCDIVVVIMTVRKRKEE